MDEYIKKSYAVDAVLDVYCDTPDIDLSCEKFEAAILKIPTADVAPVLWQPVLGYEGLYEVNQFGQIRNKDGKIMR